jgi:hypothetical protein
MSINFNKGNQPPLVGSFVLVSLPFFVLTCVAIVYSPVFRGQEDLFAIAKVAALLVPCCCLIIVLNLIERALWRSKNGRNSKPSKPEELPKAAVRALELYHAEQQLKESAADIKKALAQIGRAPAALPKGKTSYQIMWRFGVDPRKTNN